MPTDGQTPTLPRDLTEFDGTGADEYRQHWQAKHRWFAEHGIDPHDWPRVHSVLVASWKAHGIVTARERLRVVADE